LDAFGISVNLSRHPNYDLDQQRSVKGDQEVPEPWRQEYRRFYDMLETSLQEIENGRQQVDVIINHLSYQIQEYGKPQ
jgi:uncharacterized protein VirK/YbjX